MIKTLEERYATAVKKADRIQKINDIGGSYMFRKGGNMKAIMTKYIPCSETKGSRIKAYDSDNNSITIGYPHELSGEAVYKKVAIELCVKMNWDTKLIGGGIKNGYVFCFKNQ